MSEIEHYLIDMDGVLVHEERALPGADEFIPYRRAPLIWARRASATSS